MLLATATLALLFSRVDCKKVDSTFVSEYFENKVINRIVTFACWDKNDIFDYFHGLAKNGIRSSYVAINGVSNVEDAAKVDYYRIGVILDLDCSRSQFVFDQFMAARLPFNESYHWLVLTSATRLPTTIFAKLPLTVESELTAVSTNRSTYVLYDVYNHSYRHGGKLNVTQMGSWNRRDGLINLLTQYKYKRRQDFHGLTLNVSTVLFNKPEPDLETYLGTPMIKPHKDSLIRFHYTLVLYLRDIYNFTINLKLDTTWGYLENGTFTGILGDMTKDIVDIGAASFQMKPERMDVCEFTVETIFSKLYFFFRHPKKNSIRNQFLEPFLENVWWVILLLIIVIWAILLTTAMTEKTYQSEDRREPILSTSSEMALISVAAFSQQGVSREPNFFSSRIVFLTLFLWALMVFQFYSASIVGSLLAPQTKFINNIYDLANSDLRVAFEDRPYMPDYFRTTSDPASLYLQKRKMTGSKTPLYRSPEDGLDEVMRGGCAFYLDSATAYRIIERKFSQAQICELSEMLMAPPKPMFIVTSKRSPFAKMMKYGLRQMVQYGLTKRLESIFIHRKPNCPESFQSQPMPVDILEFSPAVLLLVAALLLALFILIGERLAKRLSTSRTDRVESASEVEETPSRESDEP